MQHTSRKGPRAACSQPSWFERDDLHLRDERVERPSFVGVGQKSSCIVSYTAAAAPRRRAFFMGRVLRDFAVVKKRLCGRHMALELCYARDHGRGSRSQRLRQRHFQESWTSWTLLDLLDRSQSHVFTLCSSYEFLHIG